MKYVSSHLWLGPGASEGFGCNDPSGPSRRVEPEARVVRDPAAAGDPYAWLAYEGNWGKKARGLFTRRAGPTPPEVGAPHRLGRPAARLVDLRAGRGRLGLTVTGLFCDAVAAGSEVVRRPPGVAARGEPHAAGRGFTRAGGQIVRAARRISRRRTRFLAGIGLIFALLAALGSAIQDFDGGEGRFTLPVALITGGAVSLLAYVVMTAATAEAMRRAAVGEEVRVNFVGRWSTWSPCPTSRWRSPSPTATASPGAWPRAATVRSYRTPSSRGRVSVSRRPRAVCGRTRRRGRCRRPRS